MAQICLYRFYLMRPIFELIFAFLSIKMQSVCYDFEYPQAQKWSVFVTQKKKRCYVKTTTNGDTLPNGMYTIKEKKIVVMMMHIQKT